MSVASYAGIELSFPKGTPYKKDAYLADKLVERDEAMDLDYMDLDGYYPEDVLTDVLDLFDGTQLDKVPGLYLELHYSLYEDDGWKCEVTIENGEVECSQTQISWHDCDIEATGVNIGKPKTND